MGLWAMVCRAWLLVILVCGFWLLRVWFLARWSVCGSWLTVSSLIWLMVLICILFCVAPDSWLCSVESRVYMVL